MYAGRIVEQGTLDEIFYDPQHPYTWGLLGSLTRLDRERPERLPQISGAPPSLLEPAAAAPSGRAARTPSAAAASCRGLEPRLAEAPAHLDRCWLSPEQKREHRARSRADRPGGASDADGLTAVRRARCSRSPTWSSTSRSSAGC